MRADRRDKIDFLSPPAGYDDYGEPNTSWANHLTGVWASKEPILGNEYFSANAVQSEVEVKFRTQYISTITNKMRIKHGSDTYQILSAIDPKSLNRELLIYCKKV